MPIPSNNTAPLNTFRLESGKTLTREIATKIGIDVGLNPATGDINIDIASRRIVEEGGSYIEKVNPYYTPYICENKPLPPMLQFFTSCNSKSPHSSYTINLNTLRPTKNSPIQTELSREIINELS
uniref:Uncharacterized protein n=1 Tax=viral metagenome TaxID=1070528 RepID=A0A6C0DK16_9ZZZZ